jgi:aspartate 1-decarboxylase
MTTNGQEATDLAVIRQAPGSQLETTTAHSAALAKAEVEARFAIAAMKPRDWDGARVKLMKNCKRPRFAEVARYSKPVGGKAIEGPSIRFAEAAIQCMGNVDVRTPTVFEDDLKRIIRVTVCDLESNATYSTDMVIAKTVERKFLKNGQQALDTRTNSYGDQVYIVAATDDDMLTKQAALISKAVRTLALRLIPGDLIDEAMDTVLGTLEKGDAEDPDGARKRMIDSFASVGVTPADLAKFLGHSIESCSPTERAELRAMFAAIRDGEAKWKDYLSPKTDEKPAGKVAAMRDHLRAKKADVTPQREPGDDAADEADL